MRLCSKLLRPPSHKRRFVHCQSSHRVALLHAGTRTCRSCACHTPGTRRTFAGRHIPAITGDAGQRPPAHQDEPYDVQQRIPHGAPAARERQPNPTPAARCKLAVPSAAPTGRFAAARKTWTGLSASTARRTQARAAVCGTGMMQGRRAAHFNPVFTSTHTSCLCLLYPKLSAKHVKHVMGITFDRPAGSERHRRRRRRKKMGCRHRFSCLLLHSRQGRSVVAHTCLVQIVLVCSLSSSGPLRDKRRTNLYFAGASRALGSAGAGAGHTCVGRVVVVVSSETLVVHPRDNTTY